MFKPHWVVILLAASVSAAGAMEYYTLDSVEVHQAANVDSALLGTLQPRERVEVRRCEDGWCLIGQPEVEGWVREIDLHLRGGGP